MAVKRRKKPRKQSFIVIILLLLFAYVTYKLYYGFDRNIFHSEYFPTSCLVDNFFQPEGVIFHYPINKTVNHLRELREQHRRISLKCHCKNLFVYSADESLQDLVEDSGAELQDVIIVRDGEALSINAVAELKSWILRTCPGVRYFAVDHDLIPNLLNRSNEKDYTIYDIYSNAGAIINATTPYRDCMHKLIYKQLGFNTFELSAIAYEDLYSITDMELPDSELDPEAKEFVDSSSPLEKSIVFKETQGYQTNPDDITFIISQPELCERSVSFPPFIFIAVHSAVNNTIHRKSIRETWGSHEQLQNSKAVILFFLGISANSSAQAEVITENNAFHDIVQINHTDRYRELSIKQASIYKYFSIFCNDVPYQFLFKADDDVVVDLETSVIFLQNLDSGPDTWVPPKSIYCYHVEAAEAVPRNKSYTWYTTYKEYPKKFFPPFCYGNGYFVAKMLVRTMYETFLRTPVFWMDDVYFTGFVARNIKGVHRVQFPSQRPIIAVNSPPETFLHRKKWIAHYWSIPLGPYTTWWTEYPSAQFIENPHWMAFRSRHNETIREMFIADVQNRTGTVLLSSDFDAL